MKILLSTCFSFFIFIVNGQGSITTTITVVDHNKNPLANTQVKLNESTSNEITSGTTDSNGVVVFQISSGKKWIASILDIQNAGVIDVPSEWGVIGNMLITYDNSASDPTMHQPSDRRFTKLIMEDVKPNQMDLNPNKSVVRVNILRGDSTPLTNYLVKLSSLSLGKSFITKTNSKGVAKFKVPNNSEYEVDVDDLDSYSFVKIGSESGEYDLDITYDSSTVVDYIKADTIQQIISDSTEEAYGRVLVKIKVGAGVPSNEVLYLEMEGSNTVYRSTILVGGFAYFMVPAKRKYKVHFNKHRDVQFLDYSTNPGKSTSFLVIDYPSKDGNAIRTSYAPSSTSSFSTSYYNPSENSGVNYEPSTVNEVLVNNDIPELKLLNYNDYNGKKFSSPVDNHAIEIYPKWCNAINENSKEAVMEIGYSTNNDSNSSSKPPVNVAFVIDKSGSVEGYSKIEMLKNTLLFQIQKLQKTDIISIVTFDEETNLLLAAMPLGECTNIRSIILGIQAKGGTNIYKALVRGYDQVLSNFLPNGINRVILMSDGYGTTPEDKLILKSKEFNKEGIELSTIGISRNCNKRLLTTLAVNGKGHVHVVSDTKTLEQSIEKEILSLSHTHSTDLNIEIFYSDNISFKQVFGFKALRTSKYSHKIMITDVEANANKIALVKFSIKNISDEIAKKPVLVKTKYYDTKKQKNIVKEEMIYLNWLVNNDSLPLANDLQHKKLLCIAVLNESIEAMMKEYGSGDLAKAKETSGYAIGFFKKQYPDCKDEELLQSLRSIRHFHSQIEMMAGK